jgi:hypothetical protein
MHLISVNTFLKLASAFLVFVNIAVLTRWPDGADAERIVAQFLTVNGIVSTALGFLFFSTYFEAAENKVDAPRISISLVMAVALASFVIAAVAIGASILLLAIFLPAAFLYARSGHQDAVIVRSDATGQRGRELELMRLGFRFGLVVISVATLTFMSLTGWLTTPSSPRSIDLVLCAVCLIGVAALWKRTAPPFVLTRYKIALLAGNVFWNLPRIMLEAQDYHAEVLQLSFLLAIGQGAIMVANYFYGMLLSSKFSRSLVAPILLMCAMMVALLLSIWFEPFENTWVSVSVALAIVTYAFGGLLQTIARSKFAHAFGNQRASTIYLATLAVGFPLVSIIAITAPTASIIVAAICLTQLLRSILYEIPSFAKRHKQ